MILAASPTRNIRDQCVSKVVLKNKTLLDIQINTILKFCPDARIIVVTGFDKVNSDERFETVENTKYYNSYPSDSLVLALKGLQDTNLWVIHGDLYFTKSSFRVSRMDSFCVNIDRKGSIKPNKVGVRHESGKLVCLEYGLPEKWGQMFYSPASKLKLFCSVCESSKSSFLYDIINRVNETEQIDVFTDNRCQILEIESVK
jgi:CTP:phosphocholine cytidylyltransferase-like protein